MFWPFKKRTSLAHIKGALPRAELLRRGRIAVLDDEAPEMLQDLRDRGLSIGHLTSTDDSQFQALAECFYDLLLLDYGGIGRTFGHDEGLDVLRYLKRVNPSLRILAFTARTFDASKADFFRLCDGVVKKDAGIRETLEQIEFHLSEILTPSYQFAALAEYLSFSGQQRDELERLLTRAITRSDGRQRAVAAAKLYAKGGSEKVVEALVNKTIELGVAFRTSNGST